MSPNEHQTIGEAFLEQLERQPHEVALHVMLSCSLCPITWSQLGCAVARVLLQLDEWKLQRGQHVATWLSNSLAWIAVDLACQLRGLVHVALDTRLPTATAAHLARHAHSHVLFLPADATDESQSNIAAICRAGIVRASSDESLSQFDRGLVTSLRPNYLGMVTADESAQILYTSGTMSAPKGAVLTHRNLLSNAQAKLRAAPQYADDVRLNILPFAHAYARTCELSTWILSGSQLILAPDWQTFLQLARHARPTLVNLVPYLAHKIVDLLRDVEAQQNPSTLLGDRLRLLQVGGAALARRDWEQLAAAGWPPLQGYGLTECSPVICSNRAGEQRPDTVGRVVDGVEVRLDEQGVLWTRGPHVLLEYWQAPAETAARLQDGWFCTQDLAQQDESGHWLIIGRSDDQITLSTGFKVSPHELTRRLAHDAWIESLVIVGQNRSHLAALVYPNCRQLPADLFKTDLSNVADKQFAFLRVNRFVDALRARWLPLVSDLPNYMRISRIGVLCEPLASDNGGLNFKGAVRRKFAEEVLLREQVDALYSDTHQRIPG